MPDEIARLVASLLRPAAPSSDFELNPAISLPQGRVLRPAAVLVAMWDGPSGPKLILTKRASHLKHHPGQIAFAGGKVENSDAGPEAAALREAQEEIGLDPARVEILGQLPSHETVTGFRVIPILGHIRADFVAMPEMDEVEEVFTVPLSLVLNPTHYTIEARLWRGEWRRYYAMPYGPYYIWGATARILRGLADRVRI